jgi:hypothetical protein
MEKNYWKIIKPELIKYGFEIDDYFLDNISLKTNNDYIKEKIFKLPSYIYNVDDSLNNNKIIIKKYNSKEKELIKFEPVVFLGKGSYNNIYKVKNLSNEINYVLRSSIFKLNKIEFLINNYIETFIHAFFTIYQKKYLLNDKINVNNNCRITNILKLKYFGFDAVNNCINSILDLMDGTLFDILHVKNISLDKKIKILLKAIVQIIYLIEDLQTNFKFVHNDLKSNNIFYKIIDLNKPDKYFPDNINFFIGDFGSARFELNGKLIIGNKDLAKDTSFNSRKDLSLLINSLYFSFNDTLWIDNFFKKFKLDNTIPNNNDNLVKLYYIEEKDIDTLFHPSNLKTFLHQEFKVPINCRSELGHIEDTSLSVFWSKYKIKYNY